jgi:uncharacterized membrane protein YkvA (DUF1232 family)
MSNRKNGAIVVEPDFLSSRARSIRPDEVSRIAGRADEVEAKIRRHGCLRRYVEDIVLLLGLLNDFIRGRYRKIPFQAIAAVAFALIYLINPVDLIPDFIPVAGLLDDAAVIATCLALIDSDLREYRAWKASAG